MKEALRQAGVPTAASTAAHSVDEVTDFANAIGFPLILKPRAGAGAQGTTRVDSMAELQQALGAFGDADSIAVEEFVEGHEGFYDTISISGHVAHDWITHYYPNVLEAMRHRWVSPQFITTNRIESSPSYGEVRELGGRVIEALGIGTSATHMEWFAGPKGLRFSEIGCRPPGVGAWDLYSAANDTDVYREWAQAIVHGSVGGPLSRAYSAGIIALRPSHDGQIQGYSGVDEIQQRHGQWILDAHLPEPGTGTQPVEAGYMANAWVRMRHPDYDALRGMLDDVGRTIKVHAG
jgi:formate-dependent phosphoribosylglycinamide formyltransferase (GAR transformylase)